MEKIITKTKWKILELLGEKDRSPTELSKLLKLSAPTLHKHLQYLETNKIIQKKGEIKGKTKSFNIYSLGNGFIYIIKVMHEDVSKQFLEIDKNLEIYFKIRQIPQKKFYYFIDRFWWEIQEDIDKVNSIAIFGSVASGNAREDSDIDILILTKQKNKEIEKKYGARIINNPDEKGKMIMAQVFDKNDFIGSFNSGSKFAKEVIKNMIIIYDKDDFLLNLKKEQNGTKR